MDEKIIEIMERVFNTPGIDSSTSQQNCDKWDSLNHLNLIVELEREFDIELEPEEIAEMKCFEDVKRLITSKVG